MKRTRAERRDLMERREKRFIRLEKENRTLYNKSRSTTLVPLEKPVRFGYYRTLVWKDIEKAKLRSDYGILQRILDMCAPMQWSTDRKFRYLGKSEKDWHNDRYRYDNGLDKESAIVPAVKLARISPHEYSKLEPTLQSWFRPVWKLDRWKMKEYVVGYVPYQFPTYLLRVKVFPRYFYSQIEKDWEAESQWTRLENYIKRHNYWIDISRARGWRVAGRDEWFLNVRRDYLREKIIKQEMKIENSY